jgi:hypothetical protein
MGLVVSLLALGTSLPASAVSTKSLIAKSLVLKNATSSPVLTGDAATDTNLLGAALSAYEVFRRPTPRRFRPLRQPRVLMVVPVLWRAPTTLV